MAHLNETAILMGQARSEPGAAAKVPSDVVNSLQQNLGKLCRLQEESRLRTAASKRVATTLQQKDVEFRSVAEAAGGGGGGDDEEEEGGGGGGPGATNTGPEATFLAAGGVVSLLSEEQGRVDAGVNALNVSSTRRWKEAMEAMGEGGGDDDVEVEMEAETGTLKCPITGMAMVDPQRRYVAWRGWCGIEAGWHAVRLCCCREGPACVPSVLTFSFPLWRCPLLACVCVRRSCCSPHDWFLFIPQPRVPASLLPSRYRPTYPRQQQCACTPQECPPLTEPTWLVHRLVSGGRVLGDHRCFVPGEGL